MSLSAGKTRPPWRDRIIPWYFVMAFAVVFAVNMLFVYLATKTHTGVVTEQAYEKGLAYNETLAKARAQDALGWQSHAEVAAGVLRLSLVNDRGNPVQGAEVTAHFTHPVKRGQDASFPLAERAEGRYELAVPEAHRSGQWDVTMVVQWHQQQYQHRERLTIR